MNDSGFDPQTYVANIPADALEDVKAAIDRRLHRPRLDTGQVWRDANLHYFLTVRGSVPGGVAVRGIRWGLAPSDIVGNDVSDLPSSWTYVGLANDVLRVQEPSP